MIITPTLTAEQNTTLVNSNLTVEGLLKTLIEYKLEKMKDSPTYTYNNCSLTVDPPGGSVNLTTGQVNFLKLDFGAESLTDPVNDPLANIEMWIQNFVDDTCRRLDDGKGLII